MGGSMSGTRWDKKRTVEDAVALDTAALRRRGFLARVGGLQTGVLRMGFGRQATFAVGMGEGTGFLYLRHPDDGAGSAETAVMLVSTACHLGGVRWWFECPFGRDGGRCGHRVRKLYVCGEAVGCRHCLDLTYTSRQESDKRVYAALRAGTDLSEFEAYPGMTLGQARVAVKVFALAQKREERRLARRPKRGRP